MAVTESDDSHLCVLDKGTLTSLIFVELKAPFNTSSHKKKRKKEMLARPENVYHTAQHFHGLCLTSLLRLRVTTTTAAENQPLCFGVPLPRDGPKSLAVIWSSSLPWHSVICL